MRLDRYGVTPSVFNTNLAGALPLDGATNRAIVIPLGLLLFAFS